MGANPADANNPLLSTPVATIAASLFKAALAKNEIPQDKIRALSEFCTAGAEMLVSKLQECGHLPPSKIETEEPKADDATLVLQALMLGRITWQPYDKGDPRGVISSIGLDPMQIHYTTKLANGIPKLNDVVRRDLSEMVSRALRAI